MKQEVAEKLIAQQASANDLLDYQEGSVVSRTLIDKKTGTVTLFAFDEGQGLSEHTAPFDALVHIIDGEAEITISGKGIHVKGGEACQKSVGKVNFAIGKILGVKISDL